MGAGASRADRTSIPYDPGDFLVCWIVYSSVLVRVLGWSVLTLGVLARTASGQPAEPRALSVLILPSARADGSAIRSRIERVAALISTRSRGSLRVAQHPPAVEDGVDLESSMRAATELTNAGKLDEAAATYDVALDACIRGQWRSTDPSLLVRMHLARASIALARHEGAVADQLLERLYRYDPTFEPSLTDLGPKVIGAFTRVRERLGPRPNVRREELGGACVDGRVLIVGRAAAGGVEILRFDGCKQIAEALMSSTATDEDAVASLFPEALSSPALPKKDRPRRRPKWIWGVVAAAAVAVTGLAVGLGIWASEQKTSSLYVEPRL